MGSAPHHQKLNVALFVHANTLSWPSWYNEVGGLGFRPLRNIHTYGPEPPISPALKPPPQPHAAS